MSSLLCTATFEHVSGLPEDRVVMSFPFTSTVGNDIDQGGIAAGLIGEFFATATTLGTKVGEYLSPELSRAVSHTVDTYSLDGHLDGSPHGSPIRSDVISLPNPGSTMLPGECAVVMTTRASGWATAAVETPDGADPGTEVDRPKQRHSGRMYFGPLCQVGVLDPASGRARVADGFRSVLAAAAVRLQDNAYNVDLAWCVWSRKDAIFRLITDVQVDNAFDMQRKRGVAATSRTTTATPWG